MPLSPPKTPRSKPVIPGLSLSLGITTSYLALLVLLPASTIFVMSARLSPAELWGALTADRTLAAYQLSFTSSILAALANTIFGSVVSWVLVRYDFPGRRFIDALVDLPFALPTAVAGIALAGVYGPGGWGGEVLARLGLRPEDGFVGIVLAMMLVSLPFSIRTIQPVLEEIDADTEEAAAALGAGAFDTARRFIAPALYPAMLTAFALTFAKTLGEYGSIIFIASNIPGRTEIAPLLIMTRLEEMDYPAAAAVALGMLLLSFLFLLAINTFQIVLRRRA